MLFRVSVTLCAGIVFINTARAAADPFAEGVRTTDPLTPEEQQKTFKLPPGFTIQLVAAEPQLRKPMNMAFDGAGRLWITESREYPWPTNTAPRDTIRIFSDFDANGRAQKVTTFATNLNIPIGLHPFLSPSSLPQTPDAKTHPLTWKCIAWSIPNIWLFEDTDGDGVADKQTKLLGPFDHLRDTHGNQASFRRGNDGWIYATHGFNNRSKVAGKDGHEVSLPSGNIYRFRMDGSRIEQWTHGQVNPFGLTFDAMGNLYSADCHSSPIYQLLRGGYYPSFGAPDDGLGFAPTTIQHSHGSTAICGITMLDDPSWPEEFQGNLIIGNVMTSRINRDRVEWRGSTSVGHEMPDFLSVTDPWFRPVDLQLGPDGALWVADFYNRIIGHYEVPLTHPLRDRERGRIWRIVPPKGADLAKLKLNMESVPALLGELTSLNRPRRVLAMNAIADRFGTNALTALIPTDRVGLSPNPLPRGPAERSAQLSSIVWLLERFGGLDDQILAAFKDKDVAVRVQALRVLTERGLQAASTSERNGVHERRSGINAALRSAAVAALQDADANVQRAAADALGANASEENIAPLLELSGRATANDTHLRHVIRMALRDCLAQAKTFSASDEKTSRALADVAASVTNAVAGSFLIAHLEKYSEPRNIMTRYLQHAVRFAPEKDLDALAGFIRTKFAGDLDSQMAYFKSVQDGAAQRGTALSSGVREWGTELATKLLVPTETPAAAVWVNTPLEGAKEVRSPWALQERPCADGQKAQVMSSFPLGETLTGTLRSPVFALPAQLSFYLCGHDGSPDKAVQKKNVVRLRDAVTKQILFEAWPPRNDTAQKITWDARRAAGVSPADPANKTAGGTPAARSVYVEAVDADTGASYAWLAFGRFEPALPELALGAPLVPAVARQQSGAEIARSLQLASLEPVLSKLLASPTADVEARAASARALASFYPAGTAKSSVPAEKAMAAVINDSAEPIVLREKVAAALGEIWSAGNELVAALRTAPTRLQVKLAIALASTPTGAELLLGTIADGKAAPRLLQEKAVKERLAATKPANLNERLAKLTKGLPAADLEKQKIIDQRAKKFTTAQASATKGLEVFTKNCAVCHQLDGKGALVGPQLDGVGGRGADRIIEDILDPNRNVDLAFRTTTLILADGDVTSGLFRREEGATVVLAESTGKEISVPKKNIKERRESDNSLMPENFHEVIPANDFNDLLAFLLTKTGAKK